METLNQGIQPLNAPQIDYGGASSGVLPDFFGAFGLNTDAVRNADFRRNEYAQNNQLERDLYFQNYANQFNAQEAQKNRDWQEYMSNTSYQRVVADLKKSGLNPILAFGSGGGATTPGGSSATSNTGHRPSGGFSSGSRSNGNLLGSLASILAGMYTSGASNATKLAVAEMGAKSRTASSVTQHFNDKGKPTKTITKNYN